MCLEVLDLWAGGATPFKTCSRTVSKSLGIRLPQYRGSTDCINRYQEPPFKTGVSLSLGFCYGITPDEFAVFSGNPYGRGFLRGWVSRILVDVGPLCVHRLSAVNHSPNSLSTQPETMFYEHLGGTYPRPRVISEIYSTSESARQG